ncbi:MAG: TPM domain-containing protein [Lachnospiraceae bacterium]|nr:TPM domain-containing protein [Lachnospiraceae bacterium]
MHRYKRINIFLLAMLFTLMLSCVVSAEERYRNNNGYCVDISDNADLLTQSEENSLLEKMESITDYGNVGFLTSDAVNMMTTESLARNYLYDEFGAGSNSTVFVIDMYNRMIYIYSDGEMFKKITTSYARTITDNVYKEVHDGNYCEAANQVFDYEAQLLDGQKIAQPMKIISNGLFAIAIGFLINFCVILSTYSTKQASHEEIIGNAVSTVNLTTMSVTMTKRKEIYDPPSSSSSGSGGGGGGGSSGGGGGHSF